MRRTLLLAVSLTGIAGVAACSSSNSPGDTGPGDSGTIVHPDAITGGVDAVEDAGPGGDDAAEDAAAPDAIAPDAEPGDTGNNGPLLGRLAIGTVTMQSMNCLGTPALAGTTCQLLSITGCPGVADTQVYLAISEPAMPPIIGTVVFGTGGDGRGIYEEVFPESVNNILNPTRDAGFRVVQRMWFGPDGWLDGPGGGDRLGCRPATMFYGIRTLIHRPEDGAFCAAGQSGGAAEIAYSLANYGVEDILDLGVLSGGPPMGRIDYGCLGENDPAWQQTCSELRTVMNGACTYVGNSPMILDGMYGTTDCSMHNEAMRQTFIQDSVLNPFADLDYPNTELRFIWGSRDGSEAVPLGRIYQRVITSVNSESFVDSDHFVPRSPEGGDRIVDDLMIGCLPHQ